MFLLAGILLLWLLAVSMLLLRHGRTMAALWREPVLRNPVLIVESDDWGSGPPEQSAALKEIAEVLSRHHDSTGHPAVMTIAVILAIADGPAIATTGRYRRLDLCDPLFRPILEILQEGESRQTFALQLHGMEHYWPETLMDSEDPDVRAWLQQETPGATEDLPSHLQSRWTDARTLPSRPLPTRALEQAIAEEVALFTRCLGTSPQVAVPTTFVWDERVEELWANRGVRFVVTPGVRNRCRDAHGKPGCQDKWIHNADPGAAGIIYLVRDDYFEPAMGHRAGQALEALARKTRQGRPCLLETHRSNFIGPSREEALMELDRLYRQAIKRFPDIRFMSSEALGEAFLSADPLLVVTNHWQRLSAWVNRLESLNRFSRPARLTGLLPFLRGMARLAARTRSP